MKMQEKTNNVDQKKQAIMIAGTHSGVGKTTITMGILAALSKRMSVQGFKVGPDYIDTAYHTFITGSKSRNLDNFLMDDVHVLHSFNHAMLDKDIGIIEGAMGLYDGSLANPDKGSSASISKVIACPIVLVIDGSGMALSVAALVKGYCDFDTSSHIAGVIINRVNSKSHYEILKKAIETHTQAICLGYLPKTVPQLPSRHLGLVPSCEIENLENKVLELSDLISNTIDLDGFLKLASLDDKEVEEEKKDDEGKVDGSINLKPLTYLDNTKNFDGLTIGIAYDEAFNFYYEDNIDYFRNQGGNIQFFSPLHDSVIPPNIDFLYFGGGYPEQFAKELEENSSMRRSIYHCLEKGMPYYGECGGFMYLNQEIKDFDGESYLMVGWFEGTVTMTKRLKGFGYKTLVLEEDCVLGPKGLRINCHEFHHSEVSHINLQPIFTLNKFRDKMVYQKNFCGYQKGNGVAGYPHLHFYGNEICPLSLLEAAKVYHEKRRSS